MGNYLSHDYDSCNKPTKKPEEGKKVTLYLFPDSKEAIGYYYADKWRLVGNGTISEIKIICWHKMAT